MPGAAMTLAAKAGAGELEAEQVPGGGEAGGDVEQRVIGDAVVEQRARRGHRRVCWGKNGDKQTTGQVQY